MSLHLVTAAWGGPLPFNLSGRGRVWAHERSFAAAHDRKSNSVFLMYTIRLAWLIAVGETNEYARRGCPSKLILDSYLSKGRGPASLYLLWLMSAGFRRSRNIRSRRNCGCFDLNVVLKHVPVRVDLSPAGILIVGELRRLGSRGAMSLRPRLCRADAAMRSACACVPMPADPLLQVDVGRESPGNDAAKV
jgi:hypothetical protein